MHCVRLAVFGAPDVGKTALIEVLVSHCVQPLRSLTGHDRVYSLTALLDDVIYYVTLLDMHSDLTAEQSGGRPVAADAYILMFDLMSPASFQYVRLLRDQLRLFDSGSPVFVVGNKADCAIPAGVSRVSATHPEHGHHYSHADLPVAFKDLSVLIRKQWKWAYAEVSALRDWHVQSLFRRVLQSVSQSESDDNSVPPDRLTAPPGRSPHCRLL